MPEKQHFEPKIMMMLSLKMQVVLKCQQQNVLHNNYSCAD